MTIDGDAIFVPEQHHHNGAFSIIENENEENVLPYYRSIRYDTDAHIHMAFENATD